MFFLIISSEVTTEMDEGVCCKVTSVFVDVTLIFSISIPAGVKNIFRDVVFRSSIVNSFL